MEILDYLPEILFGIGCLLAAIFFIIKYIKSTPEQKKKIISDIIYALVIKAEQEYGSKTGQAKKKEVIAQFYEKYPALSYILNADELSKLIDTKAAELTEYLKKNPDAAVNILGME